jgi:hypothetical protein
LAGKTHKSYAKTFIIYYRKASGRSVVKAFKKANAFTRLPFADKRFLEDLQQIFISLDFLFTFLSRKK